MARRPFIAGNWKMHKTPQEASALAQAIRASLEGFSAADVALCPTYVCLTAVGQAIQGSPLKLCAQNVHWEKSGAFTGEISPGMLVACGCQYVIVGHSERRQFFGETDETVNKRLKAALAAQLKVIACVGESLEERRNNRTEAVVRRQVEGALAGLSAQELTQVTLAYEPIWAIGTGVVATPDQAQEMHAHIRTWVKERFGTGAGEAMRIQYGGSVKPDNVVKLLEQEDIDGALVGGASLVAEDFVKIVKAAKP